MEQKNAYSKEDLVKAGTGEMFGEGNQQLPSDNMLMMDRILKINEEGGEHGKGEIVAELDINLTYGFLIVTLKATQLCLVV